MNKRSIRLLALFAAFALLATACGDGGGGDTTTSEPVAATTTVGAETTTTEGAETTTTGQAAEFEPIPLSIGTLLPQTGSLAPIHDALAEPVIMGAEEINELFPDSVTLEHADGATDPAIASENVDQFLTGEHSAIIGAADSGSSTAIVDKVQDAGVVMCSGSNTGASLSAFDPYYIRTAPSDELQTPVLGDLIIDDGHSSVAVVWRTDEYGVGFGEALAKYLEDSGVDVPVQEGYDQAATSFSDLMEDIGNTDATALAMITFAEGGQMVLDMQGRFDGQVYVADGFVDTVGEEQVGGQLELLEGFRGTYPSPAPASGEATFPERFAEHAPDAPLVFSAHYYDCLMVIFLAAQTAQSADPTVFVDEVVGVTGPPGEKCSLLADCMELLQAGQDIDYDGASGPLDFLPNGQPGAGTYDLFEFAGDGTHPNFDQVEISG